MRILMWCDGGCFTGFGIVADQLARRWSVHGHDVHVAAINYRGEPWSAPYTLHQLPMDDMYGYTMLRNLVGSIKPDVLFALNDPNVLLIGMLGLGGDWPIPTVLYVPIDGVNLPKSWYIPLRKAHVTVAMSKFGQRVMRNEGNVDARMVYHGVEHDVFYPTHEPRDDSHFTILAINRNSSRKNYADTFRVFDAFRRKHDDARLVVHAVANDVGGNLYDLIERYDMADYVQIDDPRDTYIGSPKSHIAHLYNTAHVKLSTSTGEGFGLTDAEALACGLPVVATDCSATSEVVGTGGILIPSQRVYTDTRMVDMALLNVDACVNAMDRLYTDDALRQQLSEAGIAHARQFDWDVAAKQFEDIMGEVI